MKFILEDLKNDRHRNTTAKAYHKVWEKFNQFVIRLDDIPKTWEERTSLFCAYLIQIKQLQSSTIKSYVSAIKSKLIGDNYEWNDNQVLLAAITSSCQKRNDIFRSRLPISRRLLEHILFETDRLFRTRFTILVYQTAFCLAYYGLLRIGELTESPHVIRAKDVHSADNKNKLLIILYSSKTHSRRHRPQKIKITTTEQYEQLYNTRKAQNKFTFFCPFTITSDYLHLRGGYDDDQEQLLIFSDGSPLKAWQLRRTLRKILKKLGLQQNLYNVHSFRIGRATDMLKEGRSVETIKQNGRWKSNAVYKYLRS